LSIETTSAPAGIRATKPTTTAFPFPNRVRWLAPHVVVGLIVAVAGLPMFILPLHADHSTFAMVGRAIADGRFPYVDIWDQKPPALFFIYALAVQGPFDIMQNVRAFDIVWTALTAAVLVELGRLWWSARAGVLAGLTYGLVSVNNIPWWQSAQPDLLAVLPLALALLLYDTSNGRWPHLIVAGVLLGVVCQLRFQLVIFIPFFPLVELVQTPTWRERGRLWFQRMAWLGVGFVALQVVLLLYLIAGGALGEFIRTMRYAAGYTGIGGPWNPPGGPTLDAYLLAFRDSFFTWASGKAVLVLPALAAGFYGSLVLRDPRISRLAIFAVLSYLAIAIQVKFFWYHYGHMFLALALLCGWAWDRAISALGRSWPRPVAYGMVVAGIVVLAINSPHHRDEVQYQWRTYIRYLRNPEERDVYNALALGNLHQIGTYVRERTAPADSIYVWGFDPAIYLIADRPPASRFMFSFPFMSGWTPPEWQEGFVQELERNRPVYFLAERGTTETWIVGYRIDMVEFIERYPRLSDFLATNYDIENEIGGVILYRRRD
jgi:hypothetical protein